MPVNRTDTSRAEPVSVPLGLLCGVCGLNCVGVRQCSCCGDLWLVCDHCEAALGRLAEAA